MPRGKKKIDVTPKDDLAVAKKAKPKAKGKTPAASDNTTRNTYNEETTYKLSRSERETIVRIADDEENWHVYSAIGKDINKMKKQGWKLIQEDYYRDGSVAGAWFEAPRRCMSFLNIKKREVSPATVEKMRKKKTPEKV